MKTVNKSTIKVIATAVEKDTESLKNLLIRNGIEAKNATKDELQIMLTSALQHSKTLREEFRNWVLKRAFGPEFLNANGQEIDPVFGLPIFGSASAGVAAATQQSTTQEQSSVPSETKPKGFFSDLTLNGILDFAKDGINNYTQIVQSKNDKAILDAAIEKERLNQQTTSDGNNAAPSSKNTMLIALGIIGVIGIGVGIYFSVKKKK